MKFLSTIFLFILLITSSLNANAFLPERSPIIDPSNAVINSVEFKTQPKLNLQDRGSQNVSQDQSIAKVKKPKQKKEKKKRRPGKRQIVALLLCIFLGLLGVHRFYLGYTGMGLLFLFTAGIFGIGWIIDIILLIIPNGLTPKGTHSYKESRGKTNKNKGSGDQ